MRILHINDYYEKIGGTETYMYSLVSEFIKLDHETFIFCHSKIKTTSKNNIFLYKENENKIIRYIFHYFNPFLYCYLIQLFDKLKLDIIHLHNCNKYTLTIILAAKRKKLPIIQTVHDFGIVCPTKSYTTPKGILCKDKFGLQCVRHRCISIFEYIYSIAPKFLRWYILKNMIDGLIAPSNILKKTIEHDNIKNVFYLPNFVAIPQFNFKKNNGTNILFIGNITKYKGLECLLKAFQLILQKIPDAKLDIYGTGGYEKAIRYIAKNMKLNNIAFHGRVSNDEIMNVYMNAKVVVVPSTGMENSPLVIYEAMSFGKPVVASKIGGIPELIIDDQTGFLLNPNDADELAEKTIKILEDDKLAEFMGHNAQNIISTKFNKELHITKLIGLYSDILKNQKINEKITRRIVKNYSNKK